MGSACITDAPCGHEAAAVTDDELMERIRLRAAKCRQKSMTARLAAVIDLIEILLSRGYDRSQAREVLIEAGWHFTMDSFDSALTRVRKRRLRTNVLGAQSMSKVAGKSTVRENNGGLTRFDGDSPRPMAEAFLRSRAMLKK